MQLPILTLLLLCTWKVTECVGSDTSGESRTNQKTVYANAFFSFGEILQYPWFYANGILCPFDSNAHPQGRQDATVPILTLEPGVDVACSVLCSQNYPPHTASLLRRMISLHYRTSWSLDGINALERSHNPDSDTETETDATAPSTQEVSGALKGVPLGLVRKSNSVDRDGDGPSANTVMLYNHIRLTIYYTTGSDGGESVSHVYMDPFSVDHSIDACPSLSYPEAARPQTLRATDATETSRAVTWSYGVRWVRDASHRPASSRDAKEGPTTMPNSLHGIAVVQSSLVVLVLAILLAWVLLRTIHRDVLHYHIGMSSDDLEDLREETGWKVVYRDVMRAPRYPKVLAYLLAMGIQVMVALVLLYIAYFLGIYSPVTRPRLWTAATICLTMSGPANGYFLVHVFYMLFRSEKGDATREARPSRVDLVGASLLLPIFLLTLFGAIASLQSSHGATNALASHEATLLACVCLVLTPLGALLGAHVACSSPSRMLFASTLPINRMPRVIPPHGAAWYLRAPFVHVALGLLPFGVSFFEFAVITRRMMLEQYGAREYELVGFVSVALLQCLVVGIEMMVILAYVDLSREHYRAWWWSPFLSSASVGIWSLLYSIYFLLASFPSMSAISLVLCTCYLLIVCTLLSLLEGAVSFLASYYFVQKLYARVRLD